MSSKTLKQIAIDERNYFTLKNLGRAGDSFNDVITNLLDQGGFDLSTALTTERIHHFLAPCNECSGSYSSEVLQKRLICDCDCHVKGLN